MLLLSQLCPNYIYAIHYSYYEAFIWCKNSSLVSLLYFLQNHTNTQYTSLYELAVIDYPGTRYRFQLIYQLLSVHYNSRIYIVCYAHEFEALPTVTHVYASASWLEREAWDLFGVSFRQHPDLRRILTDYGFKGHPLRKDFPLSGYVEVFYDDQQKKITYVPVSLAQEYRIFKFNNPWSRY